MLVDIVSKNGNLKRVELLGRSGKLKFSQTTDGLVVELAGGKLSDLACSLRITGSSLSPALLPTAAVQ